MVETRKSQYHFCSVRHTGRNYTIFIKSMKYLLSITVWSSICLIYIVCSDWGIPPLTWLPLYICQWTRGTKWENLTHTFKMHISNHKTEGEKSLSVVDSNTLEKQEHCIQRVETYTCTHWVKSSQMPYFRGRLCTVQWNLLSKHKHLTVLTSPKQNTSLWFKYILNSSA